MPPVRSFFDSSTQLQIIDVNGTKTLLVSAIPSSQNTTAKVETWIATNWATAANFPGYSVRVHVASISPFSAIIGTWNAGLNIPANWWL